MSDEFLKDIERGVNEMFVEHGEDMIENVRSADAAKPAPT